MKWGCEPALPSLVVEFPEAPTPIPSLAHPALPAHLPAESSLPPDAEPTAEAEDLQEPAGPASLPLDSEAATETLGLTQQPDDPQELPRQIHIQQHLKLHFHNQGEVSRGQNSDANPGLDLHLDWCSLRRQPLLPASIIIRNCPALFLLHLLN